MNNMSRFLSKREKDGSSHRRDKSRDKSAEKKTRPHSSEGFMSSLFKPDPTKKADKEVANQINSIKQRLTRLGYIKVEEDQIIYALNSKHAGGDVDKAFELLILFQDSVEGIVKPYNPSISMQGAENRGAVTCYLDSLLFAMFARLGSFEPILYTTFEDEPRRRLSTLIRLWVNMLRTGMLIQTDVTKLLQDALKACGWEAAAVREQQDTSEAFSFITQTLNLPLLTLKMDIYHTGAEDDKDDHKYIHERLLEVAVPEDVPGSGGIKLEDCLESYFNNRVEVRRHLERSNTLSSIRSGVEADEKGSSQHVEVTELYWSTPNTPISTGAPDTPTIPGPRLRAPSIIRSRVFDEDSTGDTADADVSGRFIRKGSQVRKEVLMPAWQFFNLIPWYTKTQPSVTDTDIATHFAQTRPVLGICLKRYGMKDDCTPYRKNTFIDIPLDIRLPHFIHEDMVSKDGPLMGDFKLSLQSIICHRGNSVNAGHYISFIRAASHISDGDIESNQKLDDNSDPPTYSPDLWLKFDDLNNPRVQYVDIARALKDEMPYLLFYQIQPTINYSTPPELEPPSYADSAIAMKASQSTSALAGVFPGQGPNQPNSSYFDGTSTPPTIRFSAEIERTSDFRRSLNLSNEERRGSVPMTEASLTSTASSIVIVSAPTTPGDESTAQRLSRAAQILTKSGSRSRPVSPSGENRISSTFSRTLNLMKSNNQLNRPEAGKDTTLLTDGAGDQWLSTEDNALRPAENGEPGRSKSKKGKSRERSKGPTEKGKEREHHHSHHHSHKSKDRSIPDRECGIM